MDLWVGKIPPGGGNGNPLRYSCQENPMDYGPKAHRGGSLDWEDPLQKGMATHSNRIARESHGQRSLAGYSPWGHTTQQLSLSLKYSSGYFLKGKRIMETGKNSPNNLLLLNIRAVFSFYTLSRCPVLF